MKVRVRNIKNILYVSVFIMAGFFSMSLQAADCGEPPEFVYKLPDGSGASAEDMQDARDRLMGYSEKVDGFITCMDQRGTLLKTYMTKEQQDRWEDDLNALHNQRRDYQLAFNEVIRTFRRAQKVG